LLSALDTLDVIESTSTSIPDILLGMLYIYAFSFLKANLALDAKVIFKHTILFGILLSVKL
jgi:hypothetical protein